jgi:hypothetical protein
VKAVEYEVVWRWAHEDYNHLETVSATTAPRAISKVRKLLTQEYCFKAPELIVLAASPKWGVGP